MKKKELEKPLKALANRRRLAIITFLKKSKEGSVGDIAEAIRLSFKATSRHLRLLTSADILDREQRGLEMYYYISPDCPKVARLILDLL